MSELSLIKRVRRWIDTSYWARTRRLRKAIGALDLEISSALDDIDEEGNIGAAASYYLGEQDVLIRKLRHLEMSRLAARLKKHGVTPEQSWFDTPDRPHARRVPTADGVAAARRQLIRLRRDEMKAWSDALVQPLSLLVALAAVLQGGCRQ